MTFIPDLNTGRGPGGEMITTEKSLQLYLSPHLGPLGISTYNDIASVSGGAGVTVDNESEYNLSTSALATDDAKLDSRQPCRFYPGQTCEVGFSMRLPDALTGAQEAFWGMDDGESGVGFGRDATGYFIYVRKAGTATKVYESNWNVDEADGTGPSGLTLDATTATRFVVEFTSTFLGLIDFSIYLWDTTTYKQQKVLVHRHAPVSGAVNSAPFAPLRITLENGITATARDIFCQERWFATVGTVPEPQIRELFQFRLNLAPTTTVIPGISIRRKTGERNQRPKIIVTGFDLIIAGADLIVKIAEGHGLTGVSWVAGQSGDETGTEVDISATAVTDGQNRFQGVFGAGNHTFNFTGVDQISLPRDQTPITMTMRTTTGTATRVDHVLRFREEY